MRSSVVLLVFMCVCFGRTHPDSGTNRVAVLQSSVSDHGMLSGDVFEEVPLGGAVIRIVDLSRNFEKDANREFPPIQPISSQELEQFQLSPLDLTAAKRGFDSIICQKDFCCHFYVKTKGDQVNSNVTLAVLKESNTVDNKDLGVEICTVLQTGEQVGDIVFEDIQISANFSKETSFITTTLTKNHNFLSNEEYEFEVVNVSDVNHVSLRLTQANVLKYFGIVGWNTELPKYYFNEIPSYFYDFMLTNEMMDIYDYVWIRLRILFVVVSIYFLEMM